MKPADKPKKVVPAAARPRPAAKGGNSSFPFAAILWNVVGAIVAIVFLSAFFQHHDPDPADPTAQHLNLGYDFMFNSMLANNLKQIEENPGKSVDEKYLLKWGPGEIVYVQQMKKLTPDTAILLLPPHEFFRQVGYVPTQNGPVLQNAGGPNVSKFSMVDVAWLSYFVYPRKVVYGDSVNSPLYAKADYLVSFNGWGQDKLNYKADRPEQFMVLPIKK